jgi:hypothetical protein
MSVLLAGPVFSAWAWPQDAPASRAAQDPPSAPDAQQDAIPPPPAKKKAAPPAPPLDEPKEAAPAPAQEQGKTTGETDDRSKTAGPAATEALSVKYQFRERYSSKADPARPELVTQYRVATLQTWKQTWERAQGAPKRIETVRQTIYTERPVQFDRVGDVVAAVRRYDRVRMKTEAPHEPLNPPLLEGLTIWYGRRPGQMPQVLSLTPDRRLREFEYGCITTDEFLPQLSFLLPTQPQRVGDSWPILRSTAKSVWNEEPAANTFEMTGTLISVAKAESGTALIATFGISGQLDVPRGGACAFNARLTFRFNPVTGAAPADTSKARVSRTGPGASSLERGQGIVEARGQITHALMALATQVPVPDTEGRLKTTATREVNLERRPFPTNANEAGAAGGVPPLELPTAAPIADEANSWLLYDDARGRFHFRHPQELHEPEYAALPPDEVHLLDQRLEVGKDVLIVKLPPKGGDPKLLRTFYDPALLRKAVDAEWAAQGLEVIPGEAGWLPDATWAPWKRKVYRLEIAVKPAEGVETYKRLFVDYYLVTLSPNQPVLVESMTIRENHVPFRNEIERVIQTFEFGAAEGKAKATPAAPATPAPTTTKGAATKE